ncbi:MAG: porin [Hyphomicrobiaceae bacterium]
MYGGLLKSASAVAIIAAAGLYGASPAKAADLGGDCCADLEERVAELEATTVRKGNRKVSLQISGYVSHHLMWWDDGLQSDAYIGDGGNYGSRWRFTGSAKISPQLTAGFLYEYTAFANSIGSLNQLNGGDDLGASGGGPGTGGTPGNLALRDSTVWLRHSQLGMIKIGHGSTSTDNLTLIDVGGLSGAATSDVSLYNGGMILREKTAPGHLTGAGGSTLGRVTWGNIILGGESWDTTRRNHILYETPTLAGFSLQAAVAEDNYWDVALRYAGEIGGFRIAGGIGYQEDTEFNQPIPSVPANFNAHCNTNLDCNRKESQLKGSASVMHIPTGLFLTFAAGTRDTENKTSGNLVNAAPTVPNRNFDTSFWWLAGGISQNFFGIGKTVLFGEYGEHNDGLRVVYQDVVSSKATTYGLGILQNVDAAAMEIFLTYKHYEADFTITSNSASCGGTRNCAMQDYQTVIVGTRISF